MKSNIEKVYSKLPQKKHNFKNHKVDLSELDNFAQAQSVVQEMYGEAYNQKTDLIEIAKKIIRDLEMAKSSSERAINLAINLENSFNQLGIEPTSDFRSRKERLYDDTEGIDEAIMIYEDIISRTQF